MKKRSDQTGSLTNLNYRTPDSRFQVPHGIGTEISQLAILQMVPEPFIRIQVRGIRWKKFHFQPTLRLAQKVLNDFRAVNQRPIPQHNHPTMEMPLKVFQKRQGFLGTDTSFHQHQKHTAGSANNRNSRKLGPTGPMLENRCFPTRRPCPDTGREQ